MSSLWPRDPERAQRYFVPDLLPASLPNAQSNRLSQTLRVIFVGESPHRDEVKSESPLERSPFRGQAGRDWWSLVAEIGGVEGLFRPVPPRSELEALCSRLKIGVMNAVSYPIDPKITRHYSEWDPAKDLLFQKGGSKSESYEGIFLKSPDSSPVTRAIESLADRLKPWTPNTAVCALGKDSEWFCQKAFQRLGLPLESLRRIPHPSAWKYSREWRGQAREALIEILSR